MLGQPGDRVLEIARVVRARPGPRDGLQMHAAVTAAQQPQLALDPAPRGAQIEMPPALDATVVDLQRAGLTAHRADAPAAPQPDRHDHAQRSEADVDHRCPGQGEQPVQCRGDAHVALLVRPLSFEQPAACDAGRRRVTAVSATSEELLEPRTPCSRGYRYARLTHNSTGDPVIALDVSLSSRMRLRDGRAGGGGTR